jgi:hypothetical protein
MKNITFAVALFAVSITAAVAAPAARADGALEPAALGSWEGTGASMTVRGAEASTFAVSLVRKDAGNGRVRMDGTVRLEGGKTLAIWEESVGGAGGGFRISSSLGSGGGRCFDNGMCQSYVERADGHAFATTIAKDGASGLRIVVTELEGGKAIRFVQQTLLRKP